MVLVIVGRTGSGKSTVLARLKTIGFSPIIEYTTRPIRDGETNGVDYHFVDDKTFDAMQDEFAESKAFQTVYGIWKYGAKKTDFIGSNKACAIGPVQAMQILDSGVPVVSVYLDSSVSVVLERTTKKRGDSIDEVKRRLETDEPFYREFEKRATVKVNASKTFDEVFDELRRKLLDIAIKAGDSDAVTLLQ